MFVTKGCALPLSTLYGRQCIGIFRRRCKRNNNIMVIQLSYVYTESDDIFFFNFTHARTQATGDGDWPIV